MSDFFSLNIYTPGGIVANNYSCSELLIPTSSGMVNILKGHTHLISELDTGILTAILSNGQKRSYTIAGGMCKVLGDNVTILAKTSEAPENIDAERAKSALSKAESRIQTATSLETIKFQRKVQRAKNRLKLANLK